MSKSLKMLALSRSRQGGGQGGQGAQNEMRNEMRGGMESNRSGQMQNEMRNGMEMNRMRNEMRGGYGGMESESRGGRARNEMRGGYEMENEMRGGSGSEMEMDGAEMRRRYSRDRRGRFTGEMENEMEMESGGRWLPPYYDVDINRYEVEPKDEMQDNYRNEMRGGGNRGGRGESRMRMEERNPVGFAAHFDSPGQSDASYKRMNEMEPKPSDQMEKGGAISQSMPKFDEQMAREWTGKMKNADGTKGPHWSMEEVKKVMSSRGIKEDPAKFYAALNMMYSDYCEVAKKSNVSNMDFFVEMAKAFLQDKDAGAQDKMAAYYEYVVIG